MKRLTTILLALLMLFSLASCSGEGSSSPTSGLTGSWEGTLDFSAEEGAEEDSEDSTTLSWFFRFTFAEDGTGSSEVLYSSDGEATPIPFTYTVEGDQLTLFYEGGQPTVYTFSQKGDTLTLEEQVTINLSRIS